MKKLFLSLIVTSLLTAPTQPIYAKITNSQILCAGIACAVLSGITTKYCSKKEAEYAIQLEELAMCLEKIDCETLEDFREKEIQLLIKKLRWKTGKWFFGGLTLAGSIAAIASVIQMYRPPTPNEPEPNEPEDDDDEIPGKGKVEIEEEGESEAATTAKPKFTRTTPPPSLGNRITSKPTSEDEESGEESEGETENDGEESEDEVAVENDGDDDAKEDTANKPPKAKLRRPKRINKIRNRIIHARQKSLVGRRANLTQKQYEEELTNIKNLQNKVKLSGRKNRPRRKKKKRELTEEQKEKIKHAKTISQTYQTALLSQKASWADVNYNDPDD